jgi:pimeloyl-ACP methyl ester carboxylesterase
VLRDYPTTLVIRASSFRNWYPPDGFGEGVGRPVVILPGVYETWHYLRPVAEALSRAGHPIHLIHKLGFNRRPIPASAEKVWRILVDLDVHDVAIVAHSKGGLIGKQLLAFHDREHRIDRMIAVATPFAGSSMSQIGPTPAMRAFRPDDPVIAALVAESAVDTRITSIFPSFDPHIPEGSRLAGGRNIELPVQGHFRILFDPELPELVVREVER